MNKRVFIERKQGFDLERQELFKDLKHNFDINLLSLRFFNVYDVFNLDSVVFEQTLNEVLHEKNRDIVFYELPKSKNIVSLESIPGQFDQRADSATQCIKLLSPSSNPIVTSGIVITFNEEISNEGIGKIKHFMINEVESRVKDLSALDIPVYNKPENVKVMSLFIDKDEKELFALYKDMSLAMSFEDLKFIQKYFKTEENRNPFETELKVLDTYWSDHCRHTTFETEIIETKFGTDNLSKKIEASFNLYLENRKTLGRTNKPITLMDLATINARIERSRNNLDDLEISEEINAASIFIDVDVDGVDEKWLLMFKNETHNHPTEIEPFGGASTCIGGAIRDPLSGRSYVYSAMRVTGAADITENINKTIPGKLPQSTISKEAAHGYSSYGNQIGLATTFVDEVYHKGYKAKRMEIGAVIGAVKAEYVRRETPEPGDIVLLLGGRTGRDGIGGATGSSKEHTVESLNVSSAEVQKGNAPEERKIQRLFRNPNVTKLIKKSNDFGAGGISVAIGELADGLLIDLDKVPTKYKGINGTELAISESQERMAVVVEEKDVETFMTFCSTENIEVTEVAVITKEKRLVMKWRGKVICNMSREFIDSSGVRQNVTIHVDYDLPSNFLQNQDINTKEEAISLLKDKNVSSKQGLVEMFDSTIGRTTVLAPFGGKYRLTKTQASVQKIPVKNKTTNTVSVMTYGFNPYISEVSPYHGSTYAVIESMSKIVASGGKHNKIRFTFQEYFERVNKDPKLWGKPFSALLGAYQTLAEFNLAAIGGKDSMSGTYHDLTVPPTLVSFAVTTEKVTNIISPEFKEPNNYIYLFDTILDINKLPIVEEMKNNFTFIEENIESKNIVSAYALTHGGILEALVKSSFGNKIGVNVSTNLSLKNYRYGAILVETKQKLSNKNAVYIGETTAEELIRINDINLTIDEALQANQQRYNEVFPILHEDSRTLEKVNIISKVSKYNVKKSDSVKVVIPVFPGTNCEYDCEAAFVNEGAEVNIIVFNNQNEYEIQKSIDLLVNEIDNSHILMLSGGFSSGDEPDGSGKFIASVLRNKKIRNALKRFLEKKHLILGICNGFQALIKSGLLPYGEIRVTEDNSPTLFKNSINRHISKFVDTKVSCVNSPWLSSFELNENHTIAMSHGEGQFIVNETIYNELLSNNQIAFQYVDESNKPTYNAQYNPNGSSFSIEGIVSSDGLILGKMGHSERYQKDLFKNIYGNKNQNIFKNGVNYFKLGGSK
ncbi:Phosphoribosylformylglycinamidine synthase [Candidatus Izimaplasma bacterium HR1]|jgi:phosphoribosylformylglycinamidine synthase|uniref:phosphoribosylformylglycinamidine synthase n=1 Tax=Candidatus Izimoplasma sp. HR1 TaxID=1541959 RepID=UPI0004F67BDB|nr:Phosphoribosylformylglycinamidine synthase [Candidatus Izimaplasma bacterium HR1]